MRVMAATNAHLLSPPPPPLASFSIRPCPSRAEEESACCLPASRSRGSGTIRPIGHRCRRCTRHADWFRSLLLVLVSTWCCGGRWSLLAFQLPRDRQGKRQPTPSTPRWRQSPRHTAQRSIHTQQARRMNATEQLWSSLLADGALVSSCQSPRRCDLVSQKEGRRRNRGGDGLDDRKHR